MLYLTTAKSQLDLPVFNHKCKTYVKQLLHKECVTYLMKNATLFISLIAYSLLLSNPVCAREAITF